MLNSAVAVTLPPAVLPPMIEMPAMRFTQAGSRSMASAKLVSGPTAATHRSGSAASSSNETASSLAVVRWWTGTGTAQEQMPILVCVCAFQDRGRIVRHRSTHHEAGSLWHHDDYGIRNSATMRPPQYSTATLSDLFHRQTVASLPEVMAALGTRARRAWKKTPRCDRSGTATRCRR